MAQGLWILERCADQRFPYRLQILKGQEPWLVLRTQDHWPAVGRNIFCLREEEPPHPDEVFDEIERVPIVAFHERGRRISVVWIARGHWFESSTAHREAENKLVTTCIGRSARLEAKLV